MATNWRYFHLSVVANAMNACQLISEPIDTAAMVAAATSSQSGAITLFTGNVREDIVDGQRIVALYYEAYPEMAIRELAAIRSQAISRFELIDCRITHRLGRLELAQCSIAVVTAAPHRLNTLKAARWIMDELKQRVPIWKKDIFADGNQWRNAP